MTPTGKGAAEPGVVSTKVCSDEAAGRAADRVAGGSKEESWARAKALMKNLVITLRQEIRMHL